MNFFHDTFLRSERVYNTALLGDYRINFVLEKPLRLSRREEIVRQINNVLAFRYHKAHLTRRLILDTSADSEMEENMVEWLRVILPEFAYDNSFVPKWI